MIRRHVISGLAILALGLVVTAPAQAGGTAGAVGVKKTATVIVKNTTTTKYYVLVVPESLGSKPTFGGYNAGTVGWAQKLGAVLVNGKSQVSYPVPAGPGGIAWVLPESVPTSLTAPLPAPPVGTASYTVAKGKTVTKSISAP